MFSGSTSFLVFAKASTLMNCKIETLCIKTNIRVSFTPPEVMDEDCLKILYYHHENFTMCQRVVEIRMNQGNEDSSKQFELNFSEVCSRNVEMYNWQLIRDYCVVYGYDYSHGIYEVGIYASLSLLEKFERFFEKIPHDSSIAFVISERNAPFSPLFVKALLRHLGRKAPIMAIGDERIDCYNRFIPCLKGPDIVQTWFYNNEPKRDLVANLSTLKNMKAEFLISLSPYYLNHISARNATSKYSHIHLQTPSADELKAMTFLSSEKNKQSNMAYSMHRSNMEKYLRRSDFN